MRYDTIEFDATDLVATITLHRPTAANALDATMGRELSDAAQRCASDPKIRAVILTGAGKMFCAGGDVSAFLEHEDDLGNYIRALTQDLHAAIACLVRMDPPLITAVNGTAAGAGFSLSLIGDFVFAAQDAKFTQAYTGIGVSPDGGSTFFLPRLVGPLLAKRLVLRNEVLSAEEAKSLGLVSNVLPGDALLAHARGVALELAHGPTLAFGEARRLIADSFSHSLEAHLECESLAIAGLAGNTRDAREGMAAFRDKRKPEYRGE
ncbi:MAG: enoyl-CoA hydratase-related protein [Pseudomonadota bacterium]